MGTKTVIINGRTYDKHSGMPLSDDVVAPKSTQTHASSVHSRITPSKTLDRRYVKRANAEPKAEKIAEKVTEKPAVVTKHAISVKSDAPSKPASAQHAIHKYAPHPKAHQKSAPRSIDIAPVVHPMVQNVHAARHHAEQTAVKRLVPKPSDVLKAEAIDEALASAPPHHRERAKSKGNSSRVSRHMSLASAGAALLILASYFTYLNMPNLSVRVAAARAGIDAQYPEYRPSGYSLSGPVAYETGRVQMQFAANGSDQAFTLAQERSSWDSEALLSDYVTPQAGSEYQISREGGTTVYTWDQNAAWVSGGIVYTIQGDAPLTPDQVRRIAVSL